MALVIVSLLACGVAVGLSLLPTKYYSSEVQLLIVQKQSQYTDAYTSQKAAEKIGTNLIKVVGTFDFLNRVIATGYISGDVFSASTEVRRKQWKKMAEAELVPETGIIRITGYGTEPGKAEDVALGVMQVLTTNAADYHGAGDTVQIKQIDGPVTSIRPVKPNIILNGIAAAVLGWVVTYTFFLLRTEWQAQPNHNVPLALQYEAPKTGLPEITPLPQVEYKVLDEYPTRPYVYGAELKDAPTTAADESPSSSEEIEPAETEPVSIHDHLKS